MTKSKRETPTTPFEKFLWLIHDKKHRRLVFDHFNKQENDEYVWLTRDDILVQLNGNNTETTLFKKMGIEIGLLETSTRQGKRGRDIAIYRLSRSFAAKFTLIKLLKSLMDDIKEKHQPDTTIRLLVMVRDWLPHYFPGVSRPLEVPPPPPQAHMPVPNRNR